MPITGPQISAATFTNVEDAEGGWELLNEAEIPSAIITESALGSYTVSLMVERTDLEAAQTALGPYMKALRERG